MFDKPWRCCLRSNKDGMARPSSTTEAGRSTLGSWLLVPCLFLVFLHANTGHCLHAPFTKLSEPIREGKLGANKPTSVRIPFQYINGFIVIDLLFQNILPLKFIVDTGAEFSILTRREVSDLLRIPYGREYRLLGADLRTPVSARLIRGIDLMLNELPLREKDLLVLQEDYFRLDLGTGSPVHGILGADILNQFVVKIDYRRKQLTFTDHKHFRLPEGYLPVTVSMRRNKPFIQADYRATLNTPVTRLNLLFDTGASLTALFHAGSHESIPSLPISQEAIMGIGLGGFILGTKGKTHSLGLGPYIVKDIPTSFQDVSALPDSSLLQGRQGILGNLLMQRFTVILNYRDSLLYLKPEKEFYSPPPADRSGLFILASGKDLRTFVIQDVALGSPAKNAGIEPGDIIISVNGIPASWFRLEDLSRKFRGKEGKHIRLRIRRANTRITAEFTLQDFL